MNTKEAIGLIFTSIEQSVGGETFVMNMPAATIETIASVMIKLFGNKGSRIKVIGGRPGEKKHEVLISKNESDSAYVFSEKCYVLLPQLNKKELLRFYGKNKKFVGDEFSSKTTTRLNNYDFEKLLKKESWLFQ